MPEQKIIDIIKELNQQIYNKFKDFKGVYLFGSRVKGNYKSDSDIDLVALFDSVDRDKEMEVHGIVCDLDYKYDIFIELFTYTPEKLEKNYIFRNEVINKGVFYGTA